jgi:hypothetical protein
LRKAVLRKSTKIDGLVQVTKIMSAELDFAFLVQKIKINAKNVFFQFKVCKISILFFARVTKVSALPQHG